jgi:hypothetical protein
MVLVNIMNTNYETSGIYFQKSTPSPPRNLKPAASAIPVDIMRNLFLLTQTKIYSYQKGSRETHL